MNRKDIFSNIFIAISAQTVSLVMSFLVAFVLPKILNVEAYSFWQLFMFYISYVGLLHFGVNDGVYLKYGSLDFDKMNKESVAGQFHILLLMQILLVVILSLVTINSKMDISRSNVCIYAIFYILLFNLSNYLSYILQAANLTRLYSYSVLIDKLFFIFTLIILMCFKSDHFNVYILFYLIGRGLCLAYCMMKCRRLIFVKITSYTEAWHELLDSMSVGIKLTLSAIASMLILGIGRFAIDMHWGIVLFGQISFAISLSYFMLTFIQQIGMVFFPILKRVDCNRQKIIYNYMYMFCFFILPLMYILIIPLKNVIAHWLPQYSQSIYFLGTILPICIFEAKMQLIYNTFFKVLRQEKYLLKINLISMIISFILTLCSVYILHSYHAVIMSMVCVIILRCLFAETVISRYMAFNGTKFAITEVFVAITYIALSITCNYTILLSVLLIVYTLIPIIYLSYFRQFIQASKRYIVN